MPTQFIEAFLPEENIWNACYLSSILKSINPLSLAIFDPYINPLFIYEIIVRAQNYLYIILILFLNIASHGNLIRTSCSVAILLFFIYTHIFCS
jgi:hypothetical protein